MKKQFLLFASALLLTACSKPYSVTVDYGNKNDGMQVYLQNYFTGEIIDSTTFADGKAVFNGKNREELHRSSYICRQIGDFRPRTGRYKHCFQSGIRHHL